MAWVLSRTLFAALLSAAAAGGSTAAHAQSPPCPAGPAALQSILASEYAFAASARVSVPRAFLEYLAEDSWVLHPAPTPGRAVYQAAGDKKYQLEWYPSSAEIAATGDLGFTSGPWVFTPAAGGAQVHGQFLTVWKRDARCEWRVQFDGGVSHATPADPAPKLLPDASAALDPRLPPATLVAKDALAQALVDFETAAARDGVAAALRTYGRDQGFVLLVDDEFPLGIGAANEYLRAHPVTGHWREASRGRSADSTLLYSIGVLQDERPSHAYAEIWQYDPKVVNWGLRVLLLSPLPRK